MESFELSINQPALTDDELAHVRRVNGYRQIFDGSHREYFYVQDNTQHRFKSVGPNFSRVLYLVDNMPGMCTLKHADILLGEPVEITPAEELDEDERVLAAIRRIRRQSRLDAALYDVVAQLGWAGRAYLQAVVRNGAVLLEPVDPATVHRHVEPGGSALTGVTIKQLLVIAGKPHLRVTHHAPGMIHHRLYRLNERNRVDAQADLSLLRPGLAADQPTGLDGLAIIEFCNYTTGGVGASDYAGGPETLVDEINNRLTQISLILDKHGDPAMVALEELFDDQGNLKISGRAIATATMDKGDPVRYLTWDAKLEFHAGQLDRSMQAFLRSQEVAPALVGLGGNTSAEGWKKFKLQIHQTLARVNRKQLHVAPSLAEAMRVAMTLEQRYALGVSYPIGDVGLVFRDGIPADDEEQMRVLTGYHAAGLMSDEMAISRMYADKQTQRAELVRLAAQREASLPTAFADGRLDEAMNEG